MSLKSTFRYWAYLSVLLLLLISCLLFPAVVNFIGKQIIPEAAILILIFFACFVWFWVFWGELRTKAIKVEITEADIIVKRFVGFGKATTYALSQFDGFETSLLSSNYSDYEYLYLMQSGKKSIKLSQFYHGNYESLKEKLAKQVAFLGDKEYSLFQEMKEIFV